HPLFFQQAYLRSGKLRLGRRAEAASGDPFPDQDIQDTSGVVVRDEPALLGGREVVRFHGLEEGLERLLRSAVVGSVTAARSAGHNQKNPGKAGPSEPRATGL